MMILTPLALVLLMVPAVLVAASTAWPVLLWWALGVGAGVLGLAAYDQHYTRRRVQLTLRREVDEKLSLGADNPVRLEVRSLSGLAGRLYLKDDPPPEFHTSERLFSLHLRPYETATLSYTTRPAARGSYPFGDLHVRGRSLLGLSYWQQTYPAGQAVAVYPNLLEVERYDYLARSDRLQQAGFRALRRPGEGREFESLRDYVPDDEYRAIDWKATARHHRPISRQYEVERSQTLILMLDAGRMMTAQVGEMAKLDHALNAALMLAYVATQKDDAVGLITFADTVRSFVPPAKGRAQVGRITEALFDLQPALVEPNYAEAFGLLFSRARKRALVVCFTDLVDVDASGRLLANLAALSPRHLPLLITLRDSDVEAAAHRAPGQRFDVYRQAMARQVLADREVALATLRRQGVLVLDSLPEKLTVESVNRYLALKARGRL